MIADTGRRDMLMLLFRESMPSPDTKTEGFIRDYVHAMFEDALNETRNYCKNRRERYEAIHFEGFLNGIEAGMRIAAWERRASHDNA